jgi:DNA-binding response OmpR family regulator
MPFHLNSAMVVEDDESLREMVTFMLYRMNFRYVIPAENGDVAWSHLKRFRVDLILSDWNMEPTNGLELLQRIHDHPVISCPRFILMSANISEDYWRKALEAGATDFLTKPFSWPQLQEIVNLACSEPPRAPSNVVPFPTRARYSNG